MTSEKTTHKQPLFFTPHQTQQLDKILMELADRIASPLVLIADITGQLVLYRGRLSTSQCTALAALAVGSFSASVEIGHFLGLRNTHAFRQQLLEGAVANLYTLAVEEELVLVVAFTRQTTLGLVRVYTQQTRNELSHIIKEAVSEREKNLQNNSNISDNFGDQLQKQLDDLF